MNEVVVRTKFPWACRRQRSSTVVGSTRRTSIEMVEKAGLGGSRSEMRTKGRQAGTGPGKAAEVERAAVRHRRSKDFATVQGRNRQFRLAGPPRAGGVHPRTRHRHRGERRALQSARHGLSFVHRAAKGLPGVWQYVCSPVADRAPGLADVPDRLRSRGQPYIHETAKMVSELFAKAISKAPSILVIEEMEAVLSDVVFVIREGAQLAARDGKRVLDADRLYAAVASLPPAGSPSAIGFGRGCLCR